MQDAVRVKPTHDGTYTVYRGTLAIVTGLTRLQAERYGVGNASHAKTGTVSSVSHTT